MNASTGNMRQPAVWPVRMSARPSARGPADVGWLVGALALAVVLGGMVSFLPLSLTIGLLGAVLVVVAGANWPLQAMLVAVALMFEVIPAEYVPALGPFKAHELVLIYLSAVVVVQTLVRGGALFTPLGPFGWPLLFLLGCVVASSIYVTVFAPNPFLLASYRIFVALFVIVIIALGARSEDAIRTLTRGALGIALLMTAIVILQSMLNIRIMTNARVEGVPDAEDVTRSIAGGCTYVMIFGVLLMVNRLLSRGKDVLLPIAGIIFFSTGLAMTFGRGVWVATGVGLLVSAGMMRGFRGVALAMVWGTVLVAVMLAGVFVIRPNVAEAVVMRAMSTGSEIETGGSFGWRKLENEYALKAIAARPLTGVGLGGEYKQTASSHGHFAVETFYIHNAYLAYPLRMGIHAALFPFLMMGAFFLVTWRALAVTDVRMRALSAALGGAFVVPCITSYTQPEWMNGYGLTAFSLLIGIQLLIVRFHAAPQARPQP